MYIRHTYNFPIDCIKRDYFPIEQLPYGQQAQVDFGEYNIEGMKKSASETFSFDDVVTVDSSGYLTKATATTPKAKIVGLIQREVLSTDDDYADNTVVPVNILDNNDNEFVATVEAGSAVQSMMHKAYDLNSEDGIDVTSDLTGVFKITKIISTTKVLGRFLSESDEMPSTS